MLSASNQEEPTTFGLSTETITLEDVLPFPLSEQTGACSVCDKKFEEHYYMDFFLNSKHIDHVEKYLKKLRLLLDSTLNAYDKLKGTSGGSRFWGEKPIVDTITEAYKSDPFLANWIPRLAAHYDSAEKTEFRTRAIGNAIFSNMSTKYRAFCDFFFREFWKHKELESDEYYLYFNLGITFDDEVSETKTCSVCGEKLKNNKKELDVKFIVEQAVKSGDDPFYKKFLSVHEFDAETDYRKLRSWFSEVEGFVHGFSESTQKLLEGRRFAPLREAVHQKRIQEPTKVKVKPVK